MENLTPDESHEAYQRGFKAGKKHSNPAPETQYRNNAQDKRLEKIEKHIEIINSEMGEVKIALEKIKGKVGIYAVIVPVLTGALGFLLSRFI